MPRKKGSKDLKPRKPRCDKNIWGKKIPPRPKDKPRAIPKSEAQARVWENMPHKPGPGRPPGPAWKVLLGRILDMTNEELKTYAERKDLTLREATAILAAKTAATNNHPERQKCLEFLVNRTDGMPRQSLELAGEDGGPISTEMTVVFRDAPPPADHDRD